MESDLAVPAGTTGGAGCCGAAPVAIGGVMSRGAATEDAAMGSGFTVRPASEGDLDAMTALVSAVGLPLEGIRKEFVGGYAVAVSGSGSIVGVAGVEAYGSAGLLRSVSVDRGWRGRGVGRSLTRNRIAFARERGLAKLWALTTTAADYFPLFGFERVERDSAPAGIASSSEFSWICPSTAAVLRLDLGSPGAADGIRSAVRSRYAAAASIASAGGSAVSSCCGGSSARPNPIGAGLYDSGATSALPEGAVLASLGCGNPTALAELRPGEVVLDLGSGGGIDVILSARRVAPGGRAFGLDMTDEMLDLARRNAVEAGAENVEFLRGHIEEIPLPDASVDVIISNCVINLSGDKRRVLAEAYRVLKPGGRFAVSDIVIRGTLPAALRGRMDLWVGCLAGALEEREFERLLREVGFQDVGVEITRVYESEDAAMMFGPGGAEAAEGEDLSGRFASAFVRAVKPIG